MKVCHRGTLTGPGDPFYDAFINHQNVRKTFLNFIDAHEIRHGVAYNAFSQFQFAEITWLGEPIAAATTMPRS